jgi:hypothetical protein
MPISEINNKAIADLSHFLGKAKGDYGNILGDIFSSGQPSYTDYISRGLEMHFNAGDETSYNSSTNPTTWSDISGNGYNMALNSGPTEPSAGDNYLQFDGTDDYGVVTLSSGDWGYGEGAASGGTETHNQTQYTFICVCSFPEDGTTGYVPLDSYCMLTSRRRRLTSSTSTRGTLIRFSRWGFEHSNYYGTTVRMEPPSNKSTYFQLNNTGRYSPSRYEIKPNTKIHAAITIDLTNSSTNNMICYINGQTFTANSLIGSAGNLSNSSCNLTYDTTTQIKDGSQYWVHGVSTLNTSYNGNLQVSTNSLTTNTYELMLYNRVLSQAEIEQNYDAYVDRYGAI